MILNEHPHQQMGVETQIVGLLATIASTAAFPSSASMYRTYPFWHCRISSMVRSKVLNCWVGSWRREENKHMIWMIRSQLATINHSRFDYCQQFHAIPTNHLFNDQQSSILKQLVCGNSRRPWRHQPQSTSCSCLCGSSSPAQPLVRWQITNIITTSYELWIWFSMRLLEVDFVVAGTISYWCDTQCVVMYISILLGQWWTRRSMVW